MNDEIDVFDRTRVSKGRLFRQLLVSAPHYDAVVLDGSVGIREIYIDLMAAGVIAHKHGGPPVVVADCTWKEGSWWLDRLACRAGIRAIDSHRITYCVLSTYELQRFPLKWKVDPERVAFTPWCYTLPTEELDRPGSKDGGVFAGGNSMRDYDALIEAAGQIPQHITIAAQVRKRNEFPTNVTVGSVPHERFVEQMRRARVVVVPLERDADRSAGQQTYLNAMAMGKAVVVTDSPGARDYVRHGETGLIVQPNDVAELVSAINWLLDPAHETKVADMCAQARMEVRQRFSPTAYADCLLRVACESISRCNKR